jgi:hypothetical protein
MSYSHVILACSVALLPALAGAQPLDAAAHGCARLRAEAESRGALLRSPSLRFQALHLPHRGDTDGLGLAQQRGYQLRALLEWPLLDLYRAERLEAAAEGQCSALAARVEVERTLSVASDLGLLEASRALAGELAAHDESVSSILRAAELRRAEGVITAPELDALRLLVLDLKERQAAAEEDIARLEGLAPRARSAAEVDAALSRYDAGLAASEREASHLRRVEAFHVDVAGGVIPDDQVDWFASISLAYDLGSLAQGGPERRALAAAHAERREAEYELAGRTRRLRSQLEARVQALRTSLEVLELKRTMLSEQRARLERGEPREAIEQRARIDLELVANAAQSAFARTLLAESVDFLEQGHD